MFHRPILTIPDSVWGLVSGYLRHRDVVSVRQTCRMIWKKTNSIIWSSLLISDEPAWALKRCTIVLGTANITILQTHRLYLQAFIESTEVLTWDLRMVPNLYLPCKDVSFANFCLWLIYTQLPQCQQLAHIEILLEKASFHEYNILENLLKTVNNNNNQERNVTTSIKKLFLDDLPDKCTMKFFHLIDSLAIYIPVNEVYDVENYLDSFGFTKTPPCPKMFRVMLIQRCIPYTLLIQKPLRVEVLRHFLDSYPNLQHVTNFLYMQFDPGFDWINPGAKINSIEIHGNHHMINQPQKHDERPPDLNSNITAVRIIQPQPDTFYQIAFYPFIKRLELDSNVLSKSLNDYDSGADFLANPTTFLQFITHSHHLDTLSLLNMNLPKVTSIVDAVKSSSPNWPLKSLRVGLPHSDNQLSERYMDIELGRFVQSCNKIQWMFISINPFNAVPRKTHYYIQKLAFITCLQSLYIDNYPKNATVNPSMTQVRNTLVFNFANRESFQSKDSVIYKVNIHRIIRMIISPNNDGNVNNNNIQKCALPQWSTPENYTN